MMWLWPPKWGRQEVVLGHSIWNLSHTQFLLAPWNQQKVRMKHFSFHKWRKNKIKTSVGTICILGVSLHNLYLEPNWPLFWLEFRPCFEGFSHQNRGQTGSRYTYILSVPFISTSGSNRTRQYPITTRPRFTLPRTWKSPGKSHSGANVPKGNSRPYTTPKITWVWC